MSHILGDLLVLAILGQFIILTVGPFPKLNKSFKEFPALQPLGLGPDDGVIFRLLC